MHKQNQPKSLHASTHGLRNNARNANSKTNFVWDTITSSWNGSDSSFADYERIRYAYDPSGAIRMKLTDRYWNWEPINDYMPYEHIYYNTSPDKMDIRNTCEGDSVLWYDKYYTEGIYLDAITSTAGSDSAVYLSVTEFPYPAPFQITGDTSATLTEVYYYKALSDSNNNYE